MHDGAISRRVAPVRPWAWVRRLGRPVIAGPYFLYTTTLVPVVLAIALAARRPGELPMAFGISAAALAAQWLLGRWAPPIPGMPPGSRC